MESKFYRLLIFIAFALISHGDDIEAATAESSSTSSSSSSQQEIGKDPAFLRIAAPDTYDEIVMPRSIKFGADDTVLSEIPITMEFGGNTTDDTASDSSSSSTSSGAAVSKVQSRCYSDGSLVVCMRAANLTTMNIGGATDAAVSIANETARGPVYCRTRLSYIEGVNYCAITFLYSAYDSDFRVRCYFSADCRHASDCGMRRALFGRRYVDLFDYMFTHDGQFTHRDEVSYKLEQCKKLELYQNSQYNCRLPPSAEECKYFTDKCPLHGD